MSFLKNYLSNKSKIWVIILSLILLPFTIIAIFNLPMGDDFYFGQVGRDNSTIRAVSFWYYNWGGRYTQELLLTIFNPLSYNSLKYFWLPPLIIIFCICISLYILLQTISNERVSSLDKLILITLLLFLVFNLMPEIGETVYWISGSYTYQVGNIFFILLVATIFRLKKDNPFLITFSLAILSIFLILLIAGTNEISMAYILGLGILFLIIHRKTKLMLLWFFLICIIAFASYISISSPGNQIRASHTNEIFKSLPKAIIESIIRGLFYLIFWLPSTIVVTIFCWKQIGKIASQYATLLPVKQKEITFVLLFFLVIIFAGFFPSLISTGWNPPRSVSPIFITYLILYFGIIIYYYYYFNILINKYIPQNNTFGLVFVLLLLTSFSNKHNIMNAYIDIVSLKVFKYNYQIKNVYRELEMSKKTTIYVLPVITKPSTLPIRWPDHYNRLVNNELEKYFSKKIEMQTKP